MEKHDSSSQFERLIPVYELVVLMFEIGIYRVTAIEPESSYGKMLHVDNQLIKR